MGLSERWYFQQHNDPKHTAATVKEWLLYNVHIQNPSRLTWSQLKTTMNRTAECEKEKEEQVRPKKCSNGWMEENFFGNHQQTCQFNEYSIKNRDRKQRRINKIGLNKFMCFINKLINLQSMYMYTFLCFRNWFFFNF